MLELPMRECKCDLDDTPLSRELVKAVMDADQYDYRETLTDEFISVEKLRSGSLAAVLIILEDFAKKFYTQQPIDLAFMLMATQIGMITAASSTTATPKKFSTRCRRLRVLTLMTFYGMLKYKLAASIKFLFDKISCGKYILSGNS